MSAFKSRTCYSQERLAHTQNMTLHEAIKKLLKEFGRPMTTKEIADELNKNKWYQKKDKSLIGPFQIHGRTNNYPQLFDRDGSTVLLLNHQNKQKTTPKPNTRKVEKRKKTLKTNLTDIKRLERSLMNEKLFKKASSVDRLVPYDPGFYCIRIKNINKFPTPFEDELTNRNHNIIYLGIASKNLNKRLLNQELRANGHGTFFRSIGAVLGYTPPKGSLINKANKKNYKFSHQDEKKIVEWINDNLKVNWVAHPDNFDTIELTLIEKYRPLLNIAKNPSAIEALSVLRARCVRIANEE